MKPKTLLVLAILTALLAGYIYFVERDIPSTDEAKALEKKVLTVEQDEVTAVTLRSGAREVRIERVEPKPASESVSDSDADSSVEPEPEWRITAPIDARADRTEVDLLLSDLTGLEIERELDEAADQVDTAAAGLDEPRAEVTLATAEGETRLAVGVEVPLSSDALVRVEGGQDTSRIVQTGFGESLLEKVGRDAGDWRDPRLFFARRDDVRSLAWTDPDGERVVLLRRGEGETFWLESPIQDRADAEKVRGLLSSLTALEATGFVDEAEPAFDAAGRLEVTLAEREDPFLVERAAESKDSEVAEDDTAEITVRVDGQLVHLEPGPVVDVVGSSASDWRSLAWTDSQTFQIEEAILDQAGEELLALRRVEGDWLRATGDAARVAEEADGETVGEEIPYTAASNVLYALTDAKAESLTDTAPSSDPLLTVTLVSGEGEETLRLFPANDDGAYLATTEGRDAVLVLPAGSVDELLDNLRELRQAEPIPAKAEIEAETEPEEAAGDAAGDGS